MLEQKDMIVVPKNPFIEEFVNFGKDESWAALFNVLATGAAEMLPISDPAYRAWVLSLAGPVFEKIGFSVEHLRDAYKERAATDDNSRKPFFSYLGQGLKNSLPSLAKDVAIHDPLYVLAMHQGINAFPDVPPSLLAATSFVAAIAAVATLDVSYNELRHAMLSRNLTKKGFSRTKYYESRFLVDNASSSDALTNAQTIFSELRKRYALDITATGTYHDQYVTSTIPVRNNRDSKIRQRTRNGYGTHTSSQVVFTRTTKQARENDQYQFFPQHKDKFYKTEGSLDDILPYGTGPIHTIGFTRHMARDPNGLFASLDVSDSLLVLELKVHEDTNLLVDAMRYVMRETNYSQTTHGKFTISSQGRT